MPDSFFAPARKICSKRGMTETAVFPSEAALIGNSRQPRTINPSSCASDSMDFFTSASGSINPMPVA
jgi:hypothetical protein